MFTEDYTKMFLTFTKSKNVPTNDFEIFEKTYNIESTVDSKIIRALKIIIAILLWFECQFLSSHACFKQHKT